nr:MAG TPA: hypothetical protein [Caudoviricetes sp.]
MVWSIPVKIKLVQSVSSQFGGKVFVTPFLCGNCC